MARATRLAVIPRAPGRPVLAGIAALALSAPLALASCGAGDADDEPAAAGTGGGELVVLAAASLHEVFAEVADVVEGSEPGIEVSLSFGGSSDVVAQVIAGAPADVVATADEVTMARAVEAGVVAGDPVVLAGNSLTLVVPPGNPAGVTGLDESLEGTALVVCAPQVPCGALAGELADRAGVDLEPVSEELSVTDVLAKVTSGHADAGLVYATDARRAGPAVETVDVPGAEELPTSYLAAVTARTEEPELAARWLETLTGPEGRRILADAGFGT